MSQCEFESIPVHVDDMLKSLPNEDREKRCTICFDSDNASLLKTYQEYLNDKLQNQQNKSYDQLIEKDCECKMVYCENCLDEWAKILKYSRCPTCKKVTNKINSVTAPHFNNVRPIIFRSNNGIADIVTNTLLSYIEQPIYMLINSSIESKNPYVYYLHLLFTVVAFVTLIVIANLILIPYFLFKCIQFKMNNRSLYEIVTTKFNIFYEKINTLCNMPIYEVVKIISNTICERLDTIFNDEQYTFQILCVVYVVSMFYILTKSFQKIGDLYSNLFEVGER